VKHSTRKKAQQGPNPSLARAEAFLNGAKGYQAAAQDLLGIAHQATDPIYFLSAHAFELGLKAFLRASGRPAPLGQEGHNLTNLLKKCEGLGMRVDRDLQNVTGLLDSEGKHHGFRYFVFESSVRPDIHYLLEVLKSLLAQAEAKVAANPTAEPKSAVMKFTVGKPVPKATGKGGR
jgi:hypothetical protein